MDQLQCVHLRLLARRFWRTAYVLTMTEHEHGSSRRKHLAKIDAKIDEACRRFDAGCGYIMIVGVLPRVGGIEDQQAAVEGLRRPLCNMNNERGSIRAV